MKHIYNIGTIRNNTFFKPYEVKYASTREISINLCTLKYDLFLIFELY